MTTEKAAFDQNVDFASLLERAVNEPGTLMRAYTLFHNYSLGNQLLALWQCGARGLQPGPINTYKGWQGLGRQVQKGQKAIWLCMPITGKGTRKEKDDQGQEVDTTYSYTRFTYKPNWFVLSQTEGDDVEFPAIPEWNADTALAKLKVERVEFTMMSGNTQGYAKGNQVAINPLAQVPLKTLFHELGHVLLGHTKDTEYTDDETLPRDIREAEAESVAYLCLEALGLDGSQFARGYIQHWLKNQTIPETSAKKIFKVADQILRAGRSDQSNVGAPTA